MTVIYVGFEEIGKLAESRDDPGEFTNHRACENWFREIPTNWNLPDRDVDHPIDMGGALLRRPVEFQGLLEPDDSPVPSAVSVEEVCENALGGA